MYSNFSQTYIAAKIKYLEAQLATFPNISTGRHGNHSVLRVKEKSGSKIKIYEYKHSSPKYTYYKVKAEQKELLQNKLSEISRFLTNISARQIRINKNFPTVLPISMKDKLIPDSNPVPKKHDYWHKGIQMRSRLELMVAAALDSLDLEFMYEPGIRIKGQTCYPDFVVFLPELGCCFIIECLGMIDDTDYLYKNMNKAALYISSGILLNTNLLLICSTEDIMPPIDEARIIISGIVNNITLQRTTQPTTYLEPMNML